MSSTQNERTYTEWTVIDGETGESYGVWSLGDSGPRDFLANGRVEYFDPEEHGWDTETFETDDGPMVQVSPIPPEGSYVAKRTVIYGPWERDRG